MSNTGSDRLGLHLCVTGGSQIFRFTSIRSNRTSPVACSKVVRTVRATRNWCYLSTSDKSFFWQLNLPSRRTPEIMHNPFSNNNLARRTSWSVRGQRRRLSEIERFSIEEISARSVLETAETQGTRPLSLMPFTGLISKGGPITIASISSGISWNWSMALQTCIPWTIFPSKPVTGHPSLSLCPATVF